ncbi:Golgi transport complex subunit [Phaffia rhodozyma]|uniref:Conserved oligomeric Golgi complex subunit 8 n=1 Tax=Phaffia rhodozyma TaxID=264483 RepID=A0A0F7SHA2_PHARH|nr:Golgi transport complex subunit [Phaffia rhodozyma]
MEVQPETQAESDLVSIQEELEQIPGLVELLKDQARAKNILDPEGLFVSKLSHDYLERISNLSLESLHSEPSLIKEESSFVSGELTSLCFREYRTFLTVHQCSSDVSTAFTSFTSSLDSLLDLVPSLEAECHAFATSTKATQAERRKAGFVLEHHDKLQDLLEIPPLLDTCVRNGYYHEAFQLGDHSKSMVDRYGDIPIVLDVGREVEKGLLVMTVQLMGLLREPIKLPALIKSVGFLKRMDVLSEDELQMAFLASRESNFRSQLVGIERERADPVRYVRRYIDLFRENVYDIISHFTTIFLDPRPPSSSTTTTAAASSPSSASSAPFSEPPSVLFAFSQQSLADLFAVLNKYIPSVEDSAALSSLLTQLTYCATSFARIGLDFRSLICQPFERAVLANAEKTLAQAELGLENVIRDSLKASRSPTGWMVSMENLPKVLDLSSAWSSSSSTLSTSHNIPTTGSIHSPPNYLAYFPSLAILCNAHINALNSLRFFAPLSQFEALVKIQAKSLDRSAELIKEYSETALSDVGITSSSSALSPTSHSSTPLPSSLSSTTSPTIGTRNHRRNPSVSAAPSEKEQVQIKKLLRAYGRAFVDGLGPFLQVGLIEGLFGGEMGSTKDALGRWDLLKGGSEERDGQAGLRVWIERLEIELNPKKTEDDRHQSQEQKNKTEELERKTSTVDVPAALTEEPEDVAAQEEEEEPRISVEKSKESRADVGDEDIDQEIQRLESKNEAV